MPYILALNCGSSSLKYQLFDANSKAVVISGNVEKIGDNGSFIAQKYPDGTKNRKDTEIKNHTEALNLVVFMLRDASMDLNEITAVGHRVVHGGTKYTASMEITDEVLKTIEGFSGLAPLHIPSNLVGIVSSQQLLPNARQFAIFDTSFHKTLPDYAYRYAVPTAWYKEMGVRRYGFHGTSHLYVSKRAAKMLGKPVTDVNIVTLHIGSGASAAAIRGGNSVDTSMGMTPLSGLTMSTRAGDIDPGIIFYAIEQLGLPPAQIQAHLNKASGILGLSECYIDHRDIHENLPNNDNCRLALDIEVNNLKKYVGGYMAVLGKVDAIVFTAGVGENDEVVREKVCTGLEELGIKLDRERNAAALGYKGSGEAMISTDDSRVKVFVIPTNEELVIVEDTIALMNGTYNPNHLEMGYSFL